MASRISLSAIILIFCADFTATASADESNLPTQPRETGVQFPGAPKA